MYRLYQMQDSGNCYKIRLTMNQLKIARKLVDVDIFKGESRTDEFLHKNGNGRVPTLQIDKNNYLAESNAIMYYLAEASHLIPECRLDRARMLQWMFFEQYSHEPYIATSRFWISLLKQPDKYADQIASKRDGGIDALRVMDKHLQQQLFFAGANYSLADICLYAYTHVADEGGFDLQPFPNILDWLSAVESQANYINMAQR